MKRLALAIALVLLFVGLAQAGPLELKHVGADAKWFGHLNLDAVRDVGVVAEMYKKWSAEHNGEAKEAEALEKLGMNPVVDLQGVTVYATQYEGEVGVGLFYVRKMDKDKLVGLLKQHKPDHKTCEHGDRTLYSWTEKKGDKEFEITGTFANDGLIVMGAGVDQVKAALDVIDGKQPGLEKDSPLVAGISRRAVFASRAIDVPEEYRKSTKCPVLREFAAASAQWVHKDGTVTAKYAFTADSPEEAENLKTVVEGFKALGMLRYAKLDDVKKVIEGMKVEVKENVVTVSLKTTIDDVRAGVKQAMEHEKAQRKGEGGGCPFMKKDEGK